MRASSVFVFAVAGLVAAQTAAPVSGCGSSIDLIIQNCLATTSAQLLACAPSDWKCMCEQVGNVLTCYNNCPSDPARVAIVNEQTSWCGAAYPGGTTTTSAPMTQATTSSGSVDAVSSSGSASPTTDSGDSVQSSASNTASPTPTTGAAMANVVPGALAAFLGLAALV